MCEGLWEAKRLILSPIIIGIVIPKFGLLKIAKFVDITYIVENL